MPSGPTIEEVRELQGRLRQWLLETPVMRCRNLEQALDTDAEIWGKLEFLQQTGTFKPRGALSVALSLTADQRAAGITAVSAGNHAIAASFAARAIGTSAKVVMIGTASPARIAAAKEYGAEVVLCDTVHEAFAMAEEISRAEGRFLIHPFEGPRVAAGTATVGLEICEQIGDFDVLICPIGGGGLCGGISTVVRQLKPDCTIYGVEPAGANSMQLSIRSGEPRQLETVDTIADSLGAPYALPYSFERCRQNVDDVVLINDAGLREAMRLLFREMKFAVEPACAATTAAIAEPLRDAIKGKKVVLVFCGSNIDHATYLSQAALT
ncbi:MAG: threonine/serine dehydratase [Woeseiaceae bacterium]